jgi:beta-phosphoglucomutase-like phosphatase (HAD superfamily)
MSLIVLFELEGVLADTIAARRDALGRSFVDERLIVPPEILARAVRGRGTEAAAKVALDELGVAYDQTATELIALRAERYFAASIGKGFSLMRGARELVASLAGRATLGIVTRARRQIAELTLGLAGLEADVASITAAEDVTQVKPSPLAYRSALARLARRGISTADTMTLEDGSVGIEAAHGAGLPCIVVGDVPTHEAVVADGYLPSLVGVGADTIIQLSARIRSRVA